MPRALGRVPLRSVVDSFGEFKSHEHAWRNIMKKLRSCRTIATSTGHDSHAYGSTTSSIQQQIIYALRRGERTKASTLLQDLGRGGHALRANDVIDILKYCARSPDPLFVMETWRTMEEKLIGLNSMCGLLIMRALCKGGYLQEASNFLNFIGENHGMHPTLPAYNIFLKTCYIFLKTRSEMHSMIHLHQCLDLMERRSVGKNEVTYALLLKYLQIVAILRFSSFQLAVWQRNLSAAHEIWKDYVKSYTPNIFALRKFVWSFTRLSDVKSAYEALQHMVALAIRGNNFFKFTAKGACYPSRLDIPMLSNGKSGIQMSDSFETEQSFPLEVNTAIQQHTTSDTSSEVHGVGVVRLDKYASKPVRRILMWSFSDVIHGCAVARDSRLAERLIFQMQSLGLQTTRHTYNGFVRAIVSERGFSEGMEVLKIMLQRNKKPYDMTLATVAVSCSRALELDMAEVLLDQISSCPFPYPYNAFLRACDIMDQPERGILMLAKMKELKVKPDIRTYEVLFSLFANVNAPYEEGNMLSKVDSAKRIGAIEMDMKKNGVQHSHESMRNLLRAFGNEGMIRELIQYLHSAEHLFCRSNTYLGTPIYNVALHALVKAKETDLAVDLFKTMKSSGIAPDDATYNIMIDCCSTIPCYRSAAALVSMLLRSGFCPKTLTYTGLVKILLEDENFNNALHLLDQVSSEEVQLDVLFYNTILRKACEKGRIDVIELISEHMHRERVQPDPGTCNHVFSAYVSRGFHNTAIEALQVLSMRMICAEEGALQEMKEEFEDSLILAEDLEVDSQILEFFKGFEEHIAVALWNLRWCAMLGFHISWSPEQSPWSRRLSINYDKRNRVTR
ncbi:hypothetical protein Tsubulata_012146 [Turnera subulata]|uniref:Pentacotripeptide-repeat region of PRORP domain-containing protein n=1 Tax=Turnera subulata TaxID=218843 RepID=A0A9Q0FCV3_9ROSI|nr:hypothetical protein Tsubulata_012146 [Turnera subulata]